MGSTEKPYTMLNSDLEDIYLSVVHYIQQARRSIAKSINAEQVIAYWHIGKIIVAKEQKGRIRANYGKQLIKALSKRLKLGFGRGFGPTNLAYMRQFYLTYSDRIFHEASGKSLKVNFSLNLSWTHYRILMREPRIEVRQFYEIEAVKNHWSTPQLERQMASFLFERLASSKDKKSVMKLANKGQTIEKPEDTLKNPLPTVAELRQEIQREYQRVKEAISGNEENTKDA